MKTTLKSIVILSSLLCIAKTNMLSHDQIPGKAQDHPIALVGGTIHPVSGPAIEEGMILFNDGKIVAIGVKIPLPENAERIDVTGKHVYPGLIGANTTVGLIEIGAVRATRDITETGAINPNVRAEVAFNPESESIPVTRANGITMVASVPQGQLIPGMSALMLLDGWTWEDMTLKAPLGLQVQWPPMTIVRAPSVRQSEKEQKKERDRELKRIRDAFAEARAYMLAKKAETRPGVPYHRVDVRWEAMIPVLEGKVPVFVHADEIQQIQAAVAWAREEKVKMVLVHGRDAWRVTSLLKENGVPVVCSPVLTTPRRRFEDYDQAFKTPKLLYDAGIAFCIDDNEEYAHERNLPYNASMAAAFGLPKEEALKSITLSSAQILGVADRVGSLEVGKDATLIVTTDDILEIMSQVEIEFIQGRKVDLTSRHTMLYEKYREKNRRVLGRQ